MVGDRKVRQWVIMAAKELGLTPTLEGGLDFKKNLTEAIDGYAGIEHTLPIAPLYNDVVTMLAQSGVTYTPTLLVQYGGPWAENYWYQHHDILKDPKVARWVPKTEILPARSATTGVVAREPVLVHSCTPSRRRRSSKRAVASDSAVTARCKDSASIGSCGRSHPAV